MTTINILPVVAGDDGNHLAIGTFAAGPFRVGLTGGNFASAWIRFPAVTIPQGATIDVAHLVLTRTVAGAASAVNTDIFAIDEDNHTAPTNDATWVTDHGIHTTATVTWDFTAAASGAVNTPSLVAVVQEIVNRAGWVTGNAMGFHIDDDGTSLTLQTWANVEGAVNLPVLHVEYTDAGGDQTLTGALFAAGTTWPTGTLTQPAGSAVTVSGTTVTVTTPGTVTILDSGLNVVYAGGSATITLPVGVYSWSSTDGPSGAFTVTAGSPNRMGGSGAIRKPPRNAGR